MKIKEVIEMAVKMEEKGREYYERAASIVKSAEIKIVFETLAVEEGFHSDRFRKMLEQTSEEEFSAVTQGFAESFLLYSDKKTLFDTVRLEESLETGVSDSIAGAIEFAMDREIESVVYYTSMMAAVSEGSVREIQEIIDEEMKHFVKLAKAKELLKK